MLVPGGFARLRRVEAHRMIRFVKRSFVAGTRMLSVCSGAFFLHAAGVLTIDRTTNWKAIDALRKIDVESVEERSRRRNGLDVGRVSAGIDMLLANLAARAG